MANDLSALEISTKDGEVRFEVRAKPRARKSAILDVREGALLLALAAPPVDGAANDELVNLLADTLGLKRSDITLVRGASARTKLVGVRGIDEATLRRRLRAHVEPR